VSTDDSKSTEGNSPESGASLDSFFGESDPLSGIRHSLRTPLNQIIGYTEMLREEADDNGMVDFLPDLQKIHTAGGQLLALINDTLAPWKLETGTVDLDSMRLEMRTPLNLIIGYSELCQEVAEDTDHARFIPDLQKINAAAKNLLALFESTSFPAQMEIAAKPAHPGFAAQAVLGSAGIHQRSDLPAHRGSLLIVDDNEMNRDMLSRRLERQGYTVTEAENGREALEVLKSRKFDLVMLDVIMPGMNGFETLRNVMADKNLRHIPVIMLSALDEIDNVVRCIEIGAEDYITKPYNPILLNARISASLEKKRLRDQEQSYLEILSIEREKSERLLLNILPKSIAERLKAGESTIADNFDKAAVLFADIADFTQVANHLSPKQTVDLLNDIFSQFDWLAELHGLEKIKTIADSYLVIGGVPNAREDYASAIAEMALEMQKVIKRFTAITGFPFSLRIGISTGPVVAGVIGRRKFIYDIWGDTVKSARAMESKGAPGVIQVPHETYDLLKEKYQFQGGSTVDLKGKGRVKTYYLTGRVIRPVPAILPPLQPMEPNPPQIKTKS
jgi:adenylate cyclase